MGNFELSRTMPWLRFLLVWFLGANFPFWLAPAFFGTGERGYLNIEYIAWGTALLFLPRAFVLPGLTLSCILDMLRITAQFYYFSAHDALTSMAYLNHLPRARVVFIALTALVAALLW